MNPFETSSPGSPPVTSAGANPLRKLMWFALICTVLAALAVPACVGASATAAKKKKKDKRSPIALVVVTLDGDGDGKLDGIKITYNERVRYAKVRRKSKRARAKTPFRVSGHTVSSVSASGNAVTLKVDESDSVNTSERPQVSHSQVKKRKKGIVDRAGNQAFAGVVKARDGIAPMLLSARTADADLDGKLDGLQLTYSESVDKTELGAFVVPGRVVTGAAISGSSVRLTLEEGSVDTDARPPVIAGAGATSDAAGNAQASSQSANADDGTPPAIVQATTADLDADGKLDRMSLVFSEVVTHPAEGAGASLAAAGYTTTSASAANGTGIEIDFVEGVSFNTGAKPNVEVRSTGQPVTDLAGNTITPSTFSGTADGAGPVITAARLRDTSYDGRIDVVAAAFSETVVYSTAAGAFSTTPAAEAAMGTLTSTGVSIGAVINLSVTQVGSCCNTNLPTGGTPVPVTYTPPGLGGVTDSGGRPAPTGTVSATDGSGPVINSAETADEDADGYLDHMYVGFSEPVVYFLGSPLTVASGQRPLDPGVGNEPKLLTTGPHAGQIELTLTELGLDDTGDRPTITYQPSSGAHYVRDALLNDSPVGAQPFTGTLDKAPPLMRSATTADANPVDGHIDTITSVWTETVASSASPGFTVVAQNPPSGYSAPSVAGGSSASGQTVTTPLTPSADPDRDVFFAVNYGITGGVTDNAAAPNPAAAPASFIGQTADCSDLDEAIGTHDDEPAYANSTALAANNSRRLATLCGDDNDEYSFAVAGGTVVKVVFSPATEALALPNRDGSYDPFTVTGPGSPAHTTTFVAGVGWRLEFTADAGGGNYSVGIRDVNSPLGDYGYCTARTEGAGSNPSCNLRQGDLAITEILKSPVPSVSTMSRYVEVKNVAPTAVASADLETLQLDVGGSGCVLQQRGDSPASIDPGEYFLISATDIPTTTTDFACPGMPLIDYGQQISLMASDGIVDAVNLGSVQIPSYTTAQVRTGGSYETSTGNDDAAGGWCASIDYHGTPGTVNSACDRFRLEEAMFMPTTTSRDGRLMIELRGNAPINASSNLLAGWQIRIRPQTGAQKTFTLSAQANPNAKGYYVLADSPDAGGDTYTPFYSEQVSDLDDYLRADVPTTVTLLRPADTCVAGTPADTIGYVPGITGNLTGADDEGTCPAYLTQPFKTTTGFAANETLQRKPYAAYGNNNDDDWCAYAPWTPMGLNAECVLQQ